MKQEKLNALRQKYTDKLFTDVDKPEHKIALNVPPLQYAGLSTLLDAPYQETMDGLDIALIGVPFDLGVTRRAGARFGPKGIREDITPVGRMNYATKVNPFNLCKIADVGDVDLPDYSLQEGIEQIEKYYKEVKKRGITPISVGGDHSITYPILKALAVDGPVGLVHIDAHCDTMGIYKDSKFHHGGPFRSAVLDGALDPERTIQIGIRGSAEPMWEFSYESGMTVIHIEDFEKMGVEAVIDRARQVIGDDPAYISFDIDGLDAAFAPGTGTPEIGGLTTREAITLLRGLRGLNLIGGDLVEVAPAYDPTSCTVQTGKQLIYEILCLVAESISEGA